MRMLYKDEKKEVLIFLYLFFMGAIDKVNFVKINLADEIQCKLWLVFNKVLGIVWIN